MPAQREGHTAGDSWRLPATLALARAAASSLAPDVAAAAIAGALEAALGTVAAAVARRCGDRTLLHVAASNGLSLADGVSLRREARAALGGETVEIELLGGTTWKSIPAQGASPVPAVTLLTCEGESVGALILLPGRRGLDATTGRFLCDIAPFCAAGLRNAALHREAHDLAFTDPLTGLANRRIADSVMHLEVRSAHRTGGRLAVLTVDLDELKRINDSLGHEAGDRALIAVARLSANAVRDTDVVARVGGDELLVILPGADHEVARAVARRILDSTRTLVFGNRPLSVSIGVAVGPATNGDNATAILRRSDAALYRAKTSGRNRIEIERPTEDMATQDIAA